MSVFSLCQIRPILGLNAALSGFSPAKFYVSEPTRSPLPPSCCRSNRRRVKTVPHLDWRDQLAMHSVTVRCNSSSENGFSSVFIAPSFAAMFR